MMSACRRCEPPRPAVHDAVENASIVATRDRVGAHIAALRSTDALQSLVGHSGCQPIAVQIHVFHDFVHDFRAR